MYLNISFFREKGNKYLVFTLLGVLVMVILFPTGSSTPKVSESLSVEESGLEEQLKKVLSSMEGVGEVEVMITTRASQSSLFEQADDSPDVCGVVVVAQGAGNASVNARISEAVKALFSVEAHKISIVKMRSQEGDR